MTGRAQVKNQRAMQANPDHPKHGTTVGYNYYNCRCPACVDAEKAYVLRKRVEKRGHDLVLDEGLYRAPLAHQRSVRARIQLRFKPADAELLLAILGLEAR